MIIINGSPSVSDDMTSVDVDLSTIEGKIDTLTTKVDAVDDYVDTEIGLIKAKTDNLPVNTSTELTSILEEAEESAEHFHNIERWFGKKAVPNAGVNEMDNVLTPFQIDSGNNAYGTAICIIGSSNTPVRAGKTLFDLHKLLIVNTERTGEVYKIRLSWGTDEATAIAAGNYCTTMIYPAATLRQTPQEIKMPRIAVGTKVWANCWCANNTGTIDFYLGLHEY